MVNISPPLFEQFLKDYKVMRDHQKNYFKNRMPSDLQNAKTYEALCDKLYLEITTPPPQATQEVLL